MMSVGGGTDGKNTIITSNKLVKAKKERNATQ